MERKAEISFGFCAFMCFLGWYNWKITVWFALSLTIHELGHLLAARICCVPIRTISFRFSGAVIQCRFCSYRKEILCAAAGPAASVILAVVAGRRLPELSVISAALGMFNLLPLFPLDGGRILRAALLLVLDEERTRRVLYQVCCIICVVLMLGACWLTVERQAGIWPVFMVLLLLWKIACGYDTVQ